jgi:outer membrane protein assembly factor BamB
MPRLTPCRPFWSLALLLAFPLAPRAAEPDAAGIVQAAGVRAGLAVRLGTGGGELEIGLAGQGFRCVHGLSAEQATTAQARKTIRAKSLYGVVAVETVAGYQQLPYADNLVNLLVADLDRLGDAAPSKQEIDRVLVPNGVAYLKQAGRWARSVKRRPAGMADWGHPFGGPDERRTSADELVGLPAGVQWLAGPIHAMAGRKSSTEGAVSAGGRIFFMTQNEHANLDADVKQRVNYLVARDAFNGLPLWERVSRGTHLGKSGAVNPRLVATDELLFVVEDGELAALDAATGKLVRTYRTESPPDKFLVAAGTLVVESQAGVTAFAVDSAERRWHHPAAPVVSGTVAGDRQVCLFQTSRDAGRSLVALDLAGGKEQWRKRIQDAEVKPFSTRYLDVAFLHADGIGLFSHEVLQVLSTKDGKELWSRKVEKNTTGLIYLTGSVVWLPDGDHVHGLDLLTGAAKGKVPSPGRVDMCAPHFATPNLVIDPRHPAGVDLRTGAKSAITFSRGACGVGFVPANGLLYTAPNACGCYRDALRGFLALTPARRAERGSGPAEHRLEKGPAYGDSLTVAAPPADDWPTYRHDPFRSAATPTAVPAKLRELWKSRVADPADADPQGEWELRVGAAVTAPVIAGGQVVLAVPNAHRVIALDAGTGKARWEFTAGGRIDTPPTLAGQLCLFGARDGWVYCLRVSDGQVVWRYRAAPADERIVAYGQLESVWPVLGSVLVHDGVAYAAAGRTPEADGGLHVHALDPRTGRVLWSQNIAKASKGGLCDLLVGHEAALCVAGHELDWKTGKARQPDDRAQVLRGGLAGFLEASWTRVPLGLRKSIQTWSYGDAAGQLLAFDPERVWGYDTNSAGKTVRGKADDMLFASGAKSWTVKLPSPLQVEALIAAKEQGFIAGPRDREHRAKSGGFVRRLAAADGRTIEELTLPAPPVYDGLAAAQGRLLVVTEDGQLFCFGS